MEGAESAADCLYITGFYPPIRLSGLQHGALLPCLGTAILTRVPRIQVCCPYSGSKPPNQTQHYRGLTGLDSEAIQSLGLTKLNPCGTVDPASSVKLEALKAPGWLGRSSLSPISGWLDYILSPEGPITI